MNTAAPSSAKSPFAWHYTTGEKFEKIVKNGVLLPTGAYIAKGEHPVIWFSLEQFWEPTASKAGQQNEMIVDIGMEGTYEKGRGLVRFGISPSRLVPWPRLAKLANIPSSARRGLQRVAYERGAIPERWCGMIGQPIPLEQIEAIDVFDGEKWVPLPQQC